MIHENVNVEQKVLIELDFLELVSSERGKPEVLYEKELGFLMGLNSGSVITKIMIEMIDPFLLFHKSASFRNLSFELKLFSESRAKTSVSGRSETKCIAELAKTLRKLDPSVNNDILKKVVLVSVRA